MSETIPLSHEAIVEAARNEASHVAAEDVSWRRLAIVNVAFVGPRGAADRGWVLIDAGLAGLGGLIDEAAHELYGDARPSAIVLTHGHFDHVGALESLAEQWDVPVYAHPLEHPYLDGRASYPPGDPSVGGGMMALLARLYPRGPVDVKSRLRPLPEDGTVPGLPDWRWLHTPGHSPGHVSFWRERDRTLVAGDAVITTRQESAYAVLVQKPEMHGPPAYFTIEWDKARESARRLAALRPEVLVPGHGQAMGGEEMRAALDRLAADFDRVAVPAHGLYVEAPARAEDGGAYR